MAKSLKDIVLEFTNIAKACPDNLQEKCFQLLLEDFLSGRAEQPGKRTKQKTPKVENKAEGNEQQDKEDKVDSTAEDFADKDLHVKARKFLKDHNLTVDHINEIFYKEGETVEPLYEDLRTTRLAESQIRIAMLHALRNAIGTGDFEFNGEKVREEAQLRKCYDPGNFTTHFKNNKSLFDSFTKYEKKSPNVKLSNEGRTELASLVKKLQ